MSLKNNYIEQSKKFGGPYALINKGISKGLIDSIMRGSIPKADGLISIAKFFDTTVEELVSSEDAKTVTTLMKVTQLDRDALAAELGLEASEIFAIETNQAEITPQFREAMDDRFGYQNLYIWKKKESGVDYIEPVPQPAPTVHEDTTEEKPPTSGLEKEIALQELVYNIRRLCDETFAVLTGQIKDWLKLEDKEWRAFFKHIEEEKTRKRA